MIERVSIDTEVLFDFDSAVLRPAGRAKLYEIEQERIRSERDSMRRGQVGTGDRSEKIRTYNFPQDRLTDHRIGLTVHNLPAIMAGGLEDVATACRTRCSKKVSTRGGRRVT